MGSLGARRKKRLVRAAKQALSPDEQVLGATVGWIRVKRIGLKTGRYGAVIVTDRRVVLFTKKLGGYEVQDFAHKLLSSVDHTKGIVFGSLDLAASGDHAHVTQIPKDEIEAISQLIRQQVALTHVQPSTQGAASVAAIRSEEDVAATIRTLASLRDDGLLSPAEFEAKKQQLLGF